MIVQVKRLRLDHLAELDRPAHELLRDARQDARLFVLGQLQPFELFEHELRQPLRLRSVRVVQGIAFLPMITTTLRPQAAYHAGPRLWHGGCIYGLVSVLSRHTSIRKD